MRKSRWHWVVYGMLLIFLVAFFLLRDGIFHQAAPKVMLSTAMEATFRQLNERFAQDPLYYLLTQQNADGKYRAELSLDLAGNTAKPIQTRAEIALDLLGNQASVRSTIRREDFTWNLNGYMDRDFLAVSAPEWIDDRYYGVHYDTFVEDIMSIPLLNLLIPDKVIYRWDQGIQSVQEIANRDYKQFVQPRWAAIDWNALPLALVSFPCLVEQRSFSQDGKHYDCQTLTYRFDGSQMKRLYPKAHCSDDAKISASLYLYGKQWISLMVDHMEHGNLTQYAFYFGENPATDDLILERRDPEKTTRISVSTNNYTDRSMQMIQITEGEKTSELCYTWMPETESWQVKNDQNVCADLKLMPNPSGFRLECDDFVQFLKLLRMDTSSLELREISVNGWISVANGSQMMAPTYTNIRDCTLEDVLKLAQNLGKYLGFQILD